MGRTLAFVYGLLCYVMFLATFGYAILFLGNWYVPKSVDVLPDSLNSQLSTGTGMAILINVILLGVWAVPHTVMARPFFKKWWTTIVPAHLERSTYVLQANILLIVLYWQWRPMTGEIWSVENATLGAILTAISLAGWALAVYSTFLIDHFDLFGMRQVWLHLKGQEYSQRPFMERSAYKLVRHPLMLGYFLAFWATPTMTQGHLLFAAVTSAYILVAIQIEERDLVAALGDDYIKYRKRTAMLIPFPKGKSGDSSG